jgi:hypothetical protein
VRALAIAIACLISVPAIAGKLKIAVAPIEGDTTKEIQSALEMSLVEDGTVVKPAVVRAALAKLQLSGELDGDDAAKLQKKVDAKIVVSGKVKKASKGARSLHLTIAVRDQDSKGVTLEFKNAKSSKFKTALHDEVVKRFAEVEEEENTRAKKKQQAEEEENTRKKKRVAEEEESSRKKKKQVEEEETTRKKKKPVEEEADTSKKKKKRVAEGETEGGGDEGDEVKVKKKRKKKKEGVTEEAPTALSMVMVDAGASFGVRRLTYSATMPPPPVGTASGAGRIEG